MCFITEIISTELQNKASKYYSTTQKILYVLDISILNSFESIFVYEMIYTVSSGMVNPYYNYTGSIVINFSPKCLLLIKWQLKFIFSCEWQIYSINWSAYKDFKYYSPK